MSKRGTTMQALIFNRYCKADEYEILQLPVPEIKSPDDILIKVHAVSINPVDVKMASGAAKMMVSTQFPSILGRDVSGTISAVGSNVPAHLKPGTEVYSLVPQLSDGTAAEYSISSANSTALKPRTISHIQAASIPLAALTALQAFDIAESHLDGGLKGKTVYIPGGLSGLGSISVQLAKNVFGAAKIITTLSPSKINKVESLLGKGIVDQVIDYTKEDPANVLASRSVDFLFDIIDGKGLASLNLMKKGGVIVSVTSLPFGADLKRVAPGLPLPIKLTLDGIGAVKQYRAGRYSVEYRSMFVRDSAEDLNRLSDWIDKGLVRPIVGRVSKLDDLNEVREGCIEVFNGKGGTGKFVIKLDDDGSQNADTNGKPL